jgi:outer membrane immunogenic protein
VALGIRHFSINEQALLLRYLEILGDYAMKKTLAAAAIALVSAAGAANAADMYAGGMKDTAFVPPPLWTGLYIGANVGGAWADLKTIDRDGIWSVPGTGWTDSASGVIGGGQIGYNWQANNVFNGFVFGVEADFGGTGFSVNHHPFGNVLVNDGIESGFTADFTGRLGYAAGPALFYIKGGWAYFDGGRTLQDNGFLPGGPFSVTTNGISGWTFGGGIEYKFAPSWSAKVEYRYFDFGNFNETLTPLFDSRFDRNLTANAVTFGVNYFVGSVYTPLK